MTLSNHLPDIEASGGVEVILEDYFATLKKYFNEKSGKLRTNIDNMITLLILKSLSNFFNTFLGV